MGVGPTLNHATSLGICKLNSNIVNLSLLGKLVFLLFGLACSWVRKIDSFVNFDGIPVYLFLRNMQVREGMTPKRWRDSLEMMWPFSFLIRDQILQIMILSYPPTN